MELKIYRSLQDAISDEPKTVGAIFYNSCYLTDAIDGGGLGKGDLQAIEAKLFINEDRIRDIRFQRDQYDRKYRKGRMRAENLAKRLIGLLLIAFGCVLARRLTFWRGIDDLLTGALIAFVTLLAMFLFIAALQWCFTSKPAKVNVEEDKDLFELSPEDYREKYGKVKP